MPEHHKKTNAQRGASSRVWHSTNMAAVLVSLIAGGCVERSVPHGSLDRSEIDFGTVVAGQVLHGTVYLVNSGDAPLTVKHVSSQCACTAAVIGPEVAAKATQRKPIAVTLDTARLSAGLLSRRIVVSTNDPTRPTVAITVKANVQREILASTGYVNFGDVKVGQHVRKVVDLTFASKQVVVKGLRSTTALVVPDLDTHGRSTRVGASFSAGSRLGRHSGILVIRTNSEFNPEVRIPMVATIVAQ
jgi:hypothetical protein